MDRTGKLILIPKGTRIWEYGIRGGVKSTVLTKPRKVRTVRQTLRPIPMVGWFGKEGPLKWVIWEDVKLLK